MWKQIAVALLFCVCASDLVAASRGLYLEAANLSLSKLEQTPSDRRARRSLAKVDEHVAARLRDPWLGYADLAYLNGYQAWRDGEIQSARNWWRKYLGVAGQRQSKKADARTEEVREFLAMSDADLAPEPGGKKIEPALRRSRRKPAADSEFIEPEVSPEELIRKAGEARRNGQLEYALRLYRMAENLDPGSDDARAYIAEVEREIR